MPIYTDTATGIKYAYSTLGQLNETETADVIVSPGVAGDIIILGSFTINGKIYVVTSIGHNAFRSCAELITVVIPNSVTSIGDYAFGSCSRLVSVNIPDSVTNIGYYAFGSCNSLTSVNIPDSVTSIGGNAFYYCTSLATICIPYGITNIAANTFVCCASLKSVDMPPVLINIGPNAFAYCSQLTSITIPDTVTNIGASAFSHCARLMTLYIPPMVTSIGVNAFNSCVRMSSVRFCSNKITIGAGAFDEIAMPSTAYIVPGFTHDVMVLLHQYFTNIILLQIPSVSYITPNEGPPHIQTKVSLTGNYLNNINVVLFGNNKATDIVVINDASIDVVAPTRIDSGVVDLTLIDIYDKSYTISDAYTYKKLHQARISTTFVTSFISWCKKKMASCIKFMWNTNPLLDRDTFVSSSS